MDTRPALVVSVGLAVAARCTRALAWLGMALVAGAALAQSTVDAPPGNGLDSGIEQLVRQLAAEGMPPAAAGAPRFEVSVGSLGPRLRLAPCDRMQPYLPHGTRLWGKSRIGLRCTEGSVKWNVYLPITVRAFAPALVATGVFAAGSTLTAADLAPAEVDLAEDASPPIADLGQAVGHVLARPLKPGQSLRQSHLKPRQWFAAGDTVTVLAQGAGFSVSGEAQALTPGIEGSPVRVRTESGRVLTGQAVGDRRVELAL